MSIVKGSLPERPSLEHLKKQAKDLLDAARSAEPSALAALASVSRNDATPARANLANAQHALAQRYGFGSWIQLKEEVHRRRALAVSAEALPSDPELRMDLVHGALDDDNLQALRALLDKDAKLADGWGDRRPIAHAAERDRAAAIDLLIDRGASLDPAHGYHHPPLSWAITMFSLDAARALARRGAPVDLWCAAGLGLVERLPAFFDAQGPIAGASRHGVTRFDAQGRALPKPPIDPGEVMADALYIACRNGQLEAARYLIERGASPAFEGFARAPALHWAAFSGNRALVQCLLEHGADPEQRDGTYASSYRLFAVRAPIEWAWLGALQRALLGDPSLANLSDASWGPPLHAAVAKGLDGHVHALLAAGADPHTPDASGLSALDRARAISTTGASARIAQMLESAAI